jgi:hypothetical protein
MTRPILSRALRVIVASGILALVGTGIGAIPAHADTFPAADCLTNCTTLFDVGGSTNSIVIPAGVTSLTATIAGSVGAVAGVPADVGFPPDPGLGGVATVNLGAAYAGQTLIAGTGGTGNGSYLQTATTLLVVAGGGGGEGYETTQGPPAPISNTFPGGTGGAPNGPGVADGGAGTGVGGGNGGTGSPTSGHGGIGDTSGANGGTTTTTNPGGTSLASGGLAAQRTVEGIDYIGGAGGTGYTGGGGGGVTDSVVGESLTFTDAAAGGGGSGYLAGSLTATAEDPNTGTGYVSITYSFTPTITTTATSAHRGDMVPATVAGLPPAMNFSVTLDGVVVATGTSNASGDASVSFTVPATQETGSFPLNLVVGATSVATSDPIAVTVVALATTGSASPLLPGMLAALLILLGVAGVAVTRRRRMATTAR